MTYLSRFLDRVVTGDPDGTRTIILGSLAILGVATGYTQISQINIHEESIFGKPLYGQELKDFIAGLDQTPGGRSDSLNLSKGLDRILADIVKSAEETIEVKNGLAVLAEAEELEQDHIVAGRYDPVGEMEIKMPAWGTKYNSGVWKYGPQTVEKLKVVNTAISQFEELVEALQKQDKRTAAVAMQEVQDTLDSYIAHFHAKEDDIDHSTKELIDISREFDSMVKPMIEEAFGENMSSNGKIAYK